MTVKLPNLMPNNQPKGNVEPHGSTWMDIQPLDPRQGQPLDLTVPHATDTILPPPLKPGQILPPLIGPVGSPSDYKADPQILHPGDYTRPKYSDLTKT